MITLIFSLEVIHAHEEIDLALAMLLCSVAMVKENQSSLISWCVPVWEDYAVVPRRLSRLIFVAASLFGRWPRKVSSYTGINDDWWTGVVVTWVGSTSKNAGLAKRTCWRNLGSDGNRSKNFLSWRVHSRASLESWKGQPHHGFREIAHLEHYSCQKIGNAANRLRFPEQGPGQGYSKVLVVCQMHSVGSWPRSSPGSGLGSWAGHWEWGPVREEGCSGHRTPVLWSAVVIGHQSRGLQWSSDTSLVMGRWIPTSSQCC